MRVVLAFLAICLVALAACSTPPEDLPRAQSPNPDSVEQEKTVPELPEPPQPPAPIEAEEVAEPEEVEAASETVAIDTSVSEFGFEGYGPGDPHPGVFESWSGELVIEDGMIVQASGVIQVNSVKTDNKGLDGHLQGDDYFNTAEFPEISFASSSITEDTMTGSLTFLGVTEEISFPVTHEDGSMSADFLLDITPYGMKSIKIRDEVRIFFTVKA